VLELVRVLEQVPAQERVQVRALVQEQVPVPVQEQVQVQVQEPVQVQVPARERVLVRAQELELEQELVLGHRHSARKQAQARVAAFTQHPGTFASGPGRSTSLPTTRGIRRIHGTKS
jgi:hypothetical protein